MIVRSIAALLPLALLSSGCDQATPPAPPTTSRSPQAAPAPGAATPTTEVLADPAQKTVN